MPALPPAPGPTPTPPPPPGLPRGTLRGVTGESTLCGAETCSTARCARRYALAPTRLEAQAPSPQGPQRLRRWGPSTSNAAQSRCGSSSAHRARRLPPLPSRLAAPARSPRAQAPAASSSSSSSSSSSARPWWARTSEPVLYRDAFQSPASIRRGSERQSSTQPPSSPPASLSGSAPSRALVGCCCHHLHSCRRRSTRSSSRPSYCCCCFRLKSLATTMKVARYLTRGEAAFPQRRVDAASPSTERTRNTRPCEILPGHRRGTHHSTKVSTFVGRALSN